MFLTGRRASELEKAVAEIGENAVGICSDISKLDDLDRMYAEVKRQAGQIDVLFANAGGGDFAPLGASPKSSTTGSSELMSKELRSLRIELRARA